MLVIKENMKKVMTEEFESVYDLREVICQNLSVLEDSETKMALAISNGIEKWAEARKRTADYLNDLISNCEDKVRQVQGNFQVESMWYKTDMVDQAIAEAKSYESKVQALFYVIGLTGLDQQSVWTKVASLIEYRKPVTVKQKGLTEMGNQIQNLSFKKGMGGKK